MLPILGLSLLFGCAQSDGKSESRPFTKPDFSEKKGDPQIIIVEVPVQGNSTTFKGKLSQAYVKGATVVADIVLTDASIGNLQQDPGEVTAVSDTEGSYELSGSYQGFVFFSKGGTITNSSGEEEPALPMLAPMPDKLGNDVNLTPLTTLVVTRPELKTKLDELGGWNYDIASPTGAPGSLLRVAKSVETLLQILSRGSSPLLDSTAAQLAGAELIAETLTTSSDLSSDTGLEQFTQKAAKAILNDPNLVAPTRLEQAGSEEQVLASIEKSIAVVTQVIANTATPVVETEVMAAIEESVNETVDEVEQLVGNSVQIGLTFTPVIEDLQLRRSAIDQLTLTAIVSDDGPLADLRYQWSMEGNEFSDLTSNPTVLLNYNDNLAGTLTLRVTDEDGTGRTTLLTRPLSTGEFPYKSP